MVRGSPSIYRKAAPLKSGATQTFRVRAIVFDLDGVLVDSMPAIRAFWTEWAGKHGVNPERVLAALHLTAEELILKFAPSLDARTEARATVAGQAEMETGIVALEGASALIDRLPRGGWAVVTSGRRERFGTWLSDSYRCQTYS
jgi:mannitol-1-/sugar-/sorbitol-6-phosphatase